MSKYPVKVEAMLVSVRHAYTGRSYFEEGKPLRYSARYQRRTKRSNHTYTVNRLGTDELDTYAKFVRDLDAAGYVLVEEFSDA